MLALMAVAVGLLVALLVLVRALTRTIATTPAAEPKSASEEPFEKDGRWWFRRGSELLVYEAGTGQWVLADTHDAMEVLGEGLPEAVGEQSEQPPIAAAPQSTVAASATSESESTFWRCPTCGAVNGSGAGSCRMCFASRP
jgi:hypothetical protein